MSLHLWEAVHDATVHSDPIFDIEPAMVGSQPPSLQRVLLAAATLWCRHLVWPSVRDIGSLAAVAPSTSIQAVGSSANLRRLLIDAEVLTLSNLMLAHGDRDDPDSAVRAISCRMLRLAEIDPALRRLPLLAALTLDHPSTEVVIASLFSASIAADWVPVAEVA